MAEPERISLPPERVTQLVDGLAQTARTTFQRRAQNDVPQVPSPRKLLQQARLFHHPKRKMVPVDKSTVRARFRTIFGTCFIFSSLMALVARGWQNTNIKGFLQTS